MHKRPLQLLFGFNSVSLTAFYAWVSWKETRAGPRVAWFAAIMLLGNIAMSAYVLRQLARLAPSDPMSTLLPARNA